MRIYFLFFRQQSSSEPSARPDSEDYTDSEDTDWIPSSDDVSSHEDASPQKSNLREYKAEKAREYRKRMNVSQRDKIREQTRIRAKRFREKQKLNTVKDQATRENIQEFFRDNSRSLPMTKQAGKFILTDTLANLHKSYNKDNPNVSLTTFKKLRPHCCLTVSKDAKFFPVIVEADGNYNISFIFLCFN